MHLASISSQPTEARAHFQTRVGMASGELDSIFRAARIAERDVRRLVTEARARTAGRHATRKEDEAITAERNRIVNRAWEEARASLSPEALAGIDRLRSAFAARIEAAPRAMPPE